MKPYAFSIFLFLIAHAPLFAFASAGPSIVIAPNFRYIPTKHIYVGDELVATVKGEGSNASIHYIHGDHLSGSNAITNATGALEELTDYLPYGKVRFDQTSGSFKESRKYTGHPHDFETGLTYMTARYYDGKSAKFMSQDAVFQSVGMPTLKEKTGLELEQYLSDPQQQNSYSYVKNNPLKHKDPTGEWYKEFASGNQSWPSFQSELGQAAGQLSADSGAWNFAFNHPYVSGAAVGIISAPAVQSGVAGLTAFGQAVPSASLSYSLAKIIEGGAFLKAAGKSLESIPKFLENLNKISSEDPNLRSLFPLVTNAAWDTAKTFSNGKGGRTTGTSGGGSINSEFISAFIKSMTGRIEKRVNQIPIQSQMRSDCVPISRCPGGQNNNVVTITTIMNQ